MVSDDSNLGERVDTLAENTKRLADAYDEEAVKRDKRIQASEEAIARSENAMRWALRIAALAVVVAIVGVIVGVIAVTTLANYKHDTQRIRINACNQSVTEKRDLASLEKDLERARRTQTPEAKALTKQFLETLHITQAQLDRLQAAQLLSFDAKVNQKIRIRDCSVKGLSDYLNGKGGYLPLSTTVPTTTKP